MNDNKALICLFLFCVAASITGGLMVPSASTAVNVKDFGAKGDNKTDDNEAITAVF